MYDTWRSQWYGKKLTHRVFTLFQVTLILSASLFHLVLWFKKVKCNTINFITARVIQNDIYCHIFTPATSTTAATSLEMPSVMKKNNRSNRPQDRRALQGIGWHQVTAANWGYKNLVLSELICNCNVCKPIVHYSHCRCIHNIQVLYLLSHGVYTYHTCYFQTWSSRSHSPPSWFPKCSGQSSRGRVLRASTGCSFIEYCNLICSKEWLLE